VTAPARLTRHPLPGTFRDELTVSGQQHPALPTVIRGPEPRVVAGSESCDSAVSAGASTTREEWTPSAGCRRDRRSTLTWTATNRVAGSLAMAVRTKHAVTGTVEIDAIRADEAIEPLNSYALPNAKQAPGPIRRPCDVRDRDRAAPWRPSVRGYVPVP
jgi:hypothetical protein